MRLRLHHKIIYEGTEHIILSSDELFDLGQGHFTGGKSSGETGIKPANALAYAIAMPTSLLDFTNHGREVEWNEDTFMVVTSSAYIEFPDEWAGLFQHEDGEKIAKELGIGKEICYIVWWQDCLLKSGKAKPDIDDDPSYTEGYRLGYTGLRWL